MKKPFNHNRNRTPGGTEDVASYAGSAVDNPVENCVEKLDLILKFQGKKLFYK